MANLYKLTVQTSANRLVNVVANSPEEAQTKVTLTEGESVSTVEDQGEVLV